MKRNTILVVTAMAVLILTSFLLYREYSEKNRPKVLLIGVDGAEWAVIDQLTAQGRLPNFKKLIDGGTSGNLRSLTPILSPIIWTSIATGKTPDKHGIAWFMVRDAKTGDGIPITSTMRETRAIWNILSDNGKSVGIIGWWASWPAEKVNGFIVSDHIAYHGFGLTSDSVETKVGLTYPAEITDEIEALRHVPQKLSKSEIDRFMNITEEEYNNSIHSEFGFRNPLQHFMYALANARTYLETYRKLRQQYDVDLMGVYFEGIDTVGHLFMKYRPPKMEGMPEEYSEKYNRVMDEYYQYQDEILGEILRDVSPNTTVIICSDHGFESGEGRLKEFFSTDVRNAAKWHRLNGVVIMNGPNIRKNAKIEGASVLDITPTILYLLGLPVARDMDGKVLKDAIEPAYLQKNKIQYVRTHDTGEREQQTTQTAQADIDDSIKQRLESLGYLGGNSSTSSYIADEIYLNRASALIQKRQFDDAVGELRKILDRDESNPKAVLFLVQIYDAQGKFEQALKEADKILVLNRRNSAVQPDLLAKAYSSKGIAYLNMGDREKALENFKKALDVNPQDADTHYNLGALFEHNDEHEKAITEYEAAVTLAPTNSFAYNNLGNIYRKLNQPEKAVSYFEKAVSANPNNVEARYNLGVCSMEKEDYPQAAAHFQQALFLRSHFPQAKLKLAFANMKMEEYGKAGSVFEDFLTQFPNSALAWYGLAVTQERTGEHEKAMSSLKRAAIIDKPIVLEKMVEDGVFNEVDVSALGGS